MQTNFINLIEFGKDIKVYPTNILWVGTSVQINFYLIAEISYAFALMGGFTYSGTDAPLSGNYFAIRLKKFLYKNLGIEFNYTNYSFSTNIYTAKNNYTSWNIQFVHRI